MKTQIMIAGVVAMVVISCFSKEISEASAPAVPVDTTFEDGTTVDSTMQLTFGPVLSDVDYTVTLNGNVLVSSTNRATFTWQPRQLGENVLVWSSAGVTMTSTVNVERLTFYVQPEPNPPMPVDANITITPETRTIEQGGGGGSIITSGSGTWTAAVSEPWIVLNTTSGSVGNPVAYIVNASALVGDRVGYVYVSGHVHTVTQHGYTSTISPASAEFETQGGSGTVAIQTTNRIAWNAKPNADWITITPTSGTGSGTISYTVAPYNEVATRTGTITVGDQTFTVRQTGRRIKLSTYREVRTDYFSHVIPVTVNALASTHWSVTPNASWISVVDAGNGVGGDSVSLAIADNLSGVTRYGTVTIGTETLLIVQGEPITITPETATADVNGANGFIAVGAWPEVSWIATIKSNWLTILGNTAQGTGCGNVVYTASPNPTLYERTGTIEVVENGSKHGYPVRTHTVIQPAATATVSPMGYEFEAGGGSFAVAIDTANIVEWKVEGCPEWLTVPTGTEGIGPQTVQLQAAENNTVYPRTVTLKIAENDFVVTQKGRGVEVEYDSILFGTDGGMGSFSIHPDGNVAWNAVSSDPTWITVFQNESGTGDAAIQYIVSPYVDNGAARTGYIAVGDKKVYITQRAYEMNIDPYLATVTGDAGSGQVGISAPLGSVWEAIATEPWIKVMTTAGSGSGTVTYQFTENLTGKVRSGKIIISGEEYTINQMYRVVMSVGVEGRGGVTGAGSYDYGADVMLTATPDADYSFSHWSGAASGTDNPVTIKIDEACKATAHFVPFVPTATATENELDGVTISWGALAWAEQYRVYRAETNQKPESSVATIAKGTLSWKDTTATPGKTYYYWVEAVGSKEQTTSAAVTGKRAVSPTGLAISCVSSLFAGQTANCVCTVSYSNGTAKDVAPIWSVVGSGLTVDAFGVLTAGTVANDTIATVQASYTESGITKTASAQVTVYPAFDVNDAASGVGTLSTGGSGAWIGQKKESCGGAVALRSTGLASGASAWIGCSVTGAGTLTFKWRKSGSGSGKLALAVNGSESAVCGEASDTWATVTKEFYDNGTKNIRWTYFGGSNVDAHGLVAEIVWTPGAAITVNFDANGGAGTMEGMTFFEGADVALTSNAFTRTGYVFAGWATSEDGEVAYLDGAAVWGMTAPVGGVVTLYAVWTPNAYTVRFAANGGEGAMADEPMTYDVAKALMACAFTKKGYTFAGWATSAGGAVKYANGATVKNLTATAGGTVTLYAKWTPNNYVIDFNPGQGGTGTMSDQPMTYDEEMALYANLFARTGYTFLGWTDDESELEEVLFYDGVVVSNLTDEVDGEYDLYAVWAANEYAVRFNANGGEGTMLDQGFLYDEEQNLHLNCFTRAGHSFAGWARSMKGAVAFADGGSASNLTAEADGLVTLYAQWSANPYTVKFDANGGEGEMSDMDCTYGVSKQLAFSSFTRVGYVFAGWATSAKGEVAYANGAAIKSIAASGVVTLYAKWMAVSYSVKFNANGGSGSMANQAMTYDAEKTLTAYAFTRMGYAFAGWATTAGGEVVYANGQTVKNLTATKGAVVNLYAKWTANGYAVMFNANGGMGTMANLAFVYDAEQKLRANGFARAGYTFAGWAMSAGGAVKYANGAAVKNLAVSGTVTLYAKWTPNGYGVTFNTNGGTGTMAVQAMTYDTAKNLATCGFTRTGYHCSGWAVSPDGPAVYAQGASVKNLTSENGGNISLYAVWAINHYTVKFNANGGAGTMADLSFTYGVEQKLRANAFMRVGWAFVGWATSAGGAVKCADGATVKNLTDADGGVVTLYAVWKNVGPAVVCEIAAEYRMKADIGVIPVEVVNVKEAVKIAVKGLPSGVKFTAKDIADRKSKKVTVPANSIYGTPTKSGVYVATVTVTPTDRKSKMVPLVKTLTFVVRNSGEHIVRAECDAAQGSVKGMGVYASGKKVTLKATAAKGYVFSGWYNGDALISRLASYVLTMPDVDVNLMARFVTVAADKKSVALAVTAGGRNIVQTKSITVKQGIYVEWPVVASALSATTVKVSGLPSGLKFTAKDVKATKTSAAVPANTIYGTPKTASKTDKNGNVTPSKVKITVTTAGKAKQEYVINVTVRGIPAEGTFNGGSASGLVTLTVAKTGKISGKYLADGKTWTLSAAGFDSWDDHDRLTATLTAKSGKEVKTVALVYEDGYFSSPLFEAWRNEWKTEPQKSLAATLKGLKVTVGEDDNIVLTVGSNGAVTAKGTFGTYSASCSTVLIPTESKGTYVVYLYFPPKAGKFDGWVGTAYITAE